MLARRKINIIITNALISHFKHTTKYNKKKKEESWKIIKGVMRFLFLVVVLCTSKPYLILLYKYEGLRFNIIA